MLGHTFQLIQKISSQIGCISFFREVKVLRLVCKNTVEEAMLSCAREKLKLEKDVTASDATGKNGPYCSSEQARSIALGKTKFLSVKL